VTGRWRVLAAPVLLVALAHAVQPLVLPWRPKFWLAGPGTALYLATAVGSWRERRWAAWVVLVAPIVGGLVIGLGGLLDAVGVTRAGLRPDLGQLGVGLLQVPTAAVALSLVRRPRLTADPSTVTTRGCAESPACGPPTGSTRAWSTGCATR
jgi:hypothetical protein